ncbi:hypothetical protein IWQ61_010751, partial [Dispira simplex]
KPTDGQEDNAIYSNKLLLVGKYENLVNFTLEYPKDNPIRTQLENLQSKKFIGVRRIRGDGNCFFRAFAFAWYEAVYADANRVRQALQALEWYATWLQDNGFNTTVHKVIQNTSKNCLKTLHQISQELSREDAQRLLENMFRNPEESNAIVLFLRYIASAYMQQHPDEYQPYMEDGMDLKTFRRGHVETMNVESDHPQAHALAHALKVDLRIVYVDGFKVMEQEWNITFPDKDGQLPQDEAESVAERELKITSSNEDDQLPQGEADLMATSRDI